jgi:hypothetical protein
VQRIEEARTSANLLLQLIQSTPPSELLQNDLITEFSGRCQVASRSMQLFMKAENPAPDNDTMLTLIETSDQLSLAMSKHQRAVLQARKVMGHDGTNTPVMSTSNNGSSTGPFAPPAGPPPTSGNSHNEGSLYARHDSDNISDVSNPFADPPAPPSDDTGAGPSVSKGKSKDLPFPSDTEPLSGQFEDHVGVEPYHPGFNPTRSYMGRQESAVGGVKMSTAVGGESNGVDKGKGKVTR